MALRVHLAQFNSPWGNDTAKVYYIMNMTNQENPEIRALALTPVIG